MENHKLARNLRKQEPGREESHAYAADTPKITQRRPARQNRATRFVVKPHGGDPFTIAVKGRVLWALDQLREAGGKGCTPIYQPGPRWSAYVFDLREMGVPIDTLREPHEGDYPGTHGRYVLRASVTLAEGGAV